MSKPIEADLPLLDVHQRFVTLALSGDVDQGEGLQHDTDLKRLAYTGVLEHLLEDASTIRSLAALESPDASAESLRLAEQWFLGEVRPREVNRDAAENIARALFRTPILKSIVRLVRSENDILGVRATGMIINFGVESTSTGHESLTIDVGTLDGPVGYEVVASNHPNLSAVLMPTNADVCRYNNTGDREEVLADYEHGQHGPAELANTVVAFETILEPFEV